MNVIGLISLALLVISVSYFYWRKAVIWVMYWVLVAGAVRKWFLPQLSDVTFFLGHLMLAGVYIRIFTGGVAKRGVGIIRNPVKIPLTFYLFWGILSMFNPKSPDFRIGILGFIIHFYYIPLIFVIPYLFSTKEELLLFLKRYAFFSFFLLALGVIQFFSPVFSPINKYVGDELSNIVTVGGHARITSTFSYITGYTSYLVFLSLILIYLLSLKRLKKIPNLFLFILFTLTIVNLLMSGSRGPLGLAIILVVIYLVISTRLGFGFSFRFLKKVIFLMVFILLVLSFTNIGKEAYDAFISRSSGSAGEIQLRIAGGFFSPKNYLYSAGPLGYGIGSTYVGVVRFNVHREEIPFLEMEPERVMLELGIVGYLLVYLVRLLLIIFTWKRFRKLKDTDLKLLALISLLFQIQFLHFGNLLFNLTAGVFYYFLVGILLILPKFDVENA